ncbi:potassium channel protein [Candidatus Saganbacteria bacterium]|nr:potassium channel protein [Candidatus Saganbacteria bacterium]
MTNNKNRDDDQYGRIKLWRQFFLPLLILGLISILGTIGFMQIGKFSFLEALYFVVVTLTTVGFRPITQMSPQAMIFDMIFVIVGIILLIVVIGRALEFIVSGEFVRIRRIRKMDKKIADLKNHFIICGYGRVGHQVAQEFKVNHIPYVVIDAKAEVASELEQENIPYIIGNMTTDESLQRAGIVFAKGLIAVADSDIDNVFVTIAARVLNSNLYIVARAGHAEVEKKLLRAGANKIISPYLIAGRRIAAMAIRPVASDFLDMVMHGDHMEFSLRDVNIAERSPLADKTLAEAAIREKTGVTVLAIRKGQNQYNLQPAGGSKLEAGDTMIVIGTNEQLDRLEKVIK